MLFDDLCVAVNELTVGFTELSTDTVNVLVAEPSEVPPLYVVSVAVAVALVVFESALSQVFGIVNVLEPVFAAML